jgi:hypothetical protein
MTLLPTYQGRPAVIVRSGCTYYIGVHDAQYLKTAKAFKRALAEAHPDRSGQLKGTKFRILTGQRETWLEREIKWYRQFGLEPPDGAKSKRQVLREKLLKAKEERDGTGTTNR